MSLSDRVSQGLHALNEENRLVERIIPHVIFVTHYYEYKEGTLKPIKRFLESKDDAHAKKELTVFVKRKLDEVKYVQIAGAVMFATVCSCLTWTGVATSNWSGPALWYSSIIFAICSVFTGAQQQLVLPLEDTIDQLTHSQISNTKLTYRHKDKQDQPSPYAIFVWQLPIMFLGYSVLCFLAGLCVVVISPLAQHPQWGDNAKVWLFCIWLRITDEFLHTVIVFSAASVFGIVCWTLEVAIVPPVREASATV